MSAPYVFCGSSAVFGTAIPIFCARAALKNLSSAIRQKGLLTTCVPARAHRLEVRLIERHLVGDPIDEDVVARHGVDPRDVDLRVLGDDEIALRCDPGDERVGEAALTAHQETDDPLFHGGEEYQKRAGE